VALEPYPINPFRWHVLLETATTFQTAEVDTRTGSVDSDPSQNVLYKPQATAATEAAKQTPLGKVYLDWGRWAVLRDVGPVPVQGIEPPQLPAGRAWTAVQFRDLRFDYDFRGSGRSPATAPLTGWVYIVDGREEAGEAMNGREQH
jgi:inner membrane protein